MTGVPGTRVPRRAVVRSGIPRRTRTIRPRSRRIASTGVGGRIASTGVVTGRVAPRRGTVALLGTVALPGAVVRIGSRRWSDLARRTWVALRHAGGPDGRCISTVVGRREAHAGAWAVLAVVSTWARLVRGLALLLRWRRRRSMCLRRPRCRAFLTIHARRRSRSHVRARSRLRERGLISRGPVFAIGVRLRCGRRGRRHLRMRILPQVAVGSLARWTLRHRRLRDRLACYSLTRARVVARRHRRRSRPDLRRTARLVHRLSNRVRRTRHT